MSRRRLPLLIGVTALLVLTGLAGAANAERIGFEPGGNITMAGPATFALEGTNIECNLTLRGSLTRELVSTASGTTVGAVNEGTSACPSGTTVRILIPRIIVLRVILREPRGEVSGWLVRIENAGFLIETSLGLIQCLYGAELSLLFGIGREFAVVRFLEGPIPLRVVRSLNIFSCPIATMATGSWTMTPGQHGIFLPF